ncbi:head-tail connector protein [Effusibacillus dendaii]|uniref:Phage gp6-like head-tail connector protein n=1 Tax=Effusibacillus dendaii TaxID=2743772 RepID=A0A7I8DC95_9BACL|nr:head-tail connector protein [Effusibacillus dendaii]BCJ86456.1 hypothetical protein skT53_14410 [Effusibacillus dendaii]
MALKLITAPTEEPIALNDVKGYLRIDGTDFDALLTGLIKAAREYCEAFQNRAYVTQTWEMSLDAFPDLPLKLPKPPLQSVVSVKYTDQNGVESVFAPSNYLVDPVSEPGRLAFAYGKSWPSVTLQPVNAVKIQFVAGYGAAAAVPQAVKTAMMLYIAHRFENPDGDDVPEAVHSLLWAERVVPV